MDSVGSATMAKASLNGQNIYNGCNTMSIDFSKLSNISVKVNNEKSRDYTIPIQNSNNNNLIISSPRNPHSWHQNPGILSGMIIINLILNYYLIFYSLDVPNIGFRQNNSQYIYNDSIPVNNLPSPFVLPGQMNAFNSNIYNGFNNIGCPVVIVNGLPEEKIKIDILFTLFGVFGDVIRIKILYNKRDTVLIQYDESDQAQNAIRYMNGIFLWNRVIKVSLSKHNSISISKTTNSSGTDSNEFSKDFRDSKLHRFKRKSNNTKNISAPSSVLYLSGVIFIIYIYISLLICI